MRWWESSSYINTKKSILPQGYVELQELWLADMDLRPPKNSRGHFLGDLAANFCFPTIYAAIPSDPWSYKIKTNINQL